MNLVQIPGVNPKTTKFEMFVYEEKTKNKKAVSFIFGGNEFVEVSFLHHVKYEERNPYTMQSFASSASSGVYGSSSSSSPLHRSGSLSPADNLGGEEKELKMSEQKQINCRVTLRLNLNNNNNNNSTQSPTSISNAFSSASVSASGASASSRNHRQQQSQTIRVKLVPQDEVTINNIGSFSSQNTLALDQQVELHPISKSEWFTFEIAEGCRNKYWNMEFYLVLNNNEAMFIGYIPRIYVFAPGTFHYKQQGSKANPAKKRRLSKDWEREKK